MILLLLNDLLFSPCALASGGSICSEARAPWMDGVHMGPVGVLMHGVMQVLQSVCPDRLRASKTPSRCRQSNICVLSRTSTSLARSSLSTLSSSSCLASTFLECLNLFYCCPVYLVLACRSLFYVCCPANLVLLLTDCRMTRNWARERMVWRSPAAAISHKSPLTEVRYVSSSPSWTGKFSLYQSLRSLRRVLCCPTIFLKQIVFERARPIINPTLLYPSLSLCPSVWRLGQFQRVSHLGSAMPHTP